MDNVISSANGSPSVSIILRIVLRIPLFIIFLACATHTIEKMHNTITSVMINIFSALAKMKITIARTLIIGPASFRKNRFLFPTSE